jgi:hypothetical protein
MLPCANGFRIARAMLRDGTFEIRCSAQAKEVVYQEQGTMSGGHRSIAKSLVPCVILSRKRMKRGSFT